MRGRVSTRTVKSREGAIIGMPLFPIDIWYKMWYSVCSRATRPRTQDKEKEMFKTELGEWAFTIGFVVLFLIVVWFVG
jgi:hypothetical protein